MAKAQGISLNWSGLSDPRIDALRDKMTCVEDKARSPVPRGAQIVLRTSADDLLKAVDLKDFKELSTELKR